MHTFPKLGGAARSAFRLTLLLACPLLARAQAANEPVTQLDPFVIYGRSIDLVGEVPSASVGQVGAAELAARPFLRRGELLEVIPGVIITQHSGDGKANQYFLRGFDLDHGTDFATTVDGLPVNMRTNAHGQGYSDLNFIIPEFVQSVTYQKGLSFAENGDLSAAGAAQFHLANSLPQAFAKVEVGENDYYRFAAGDTIATGPRQTTTVGLEASYDNGPWTNPENARRFNGLLRHTWTDGNNEFALTALGYHGDWTSTDQVPLRAITGGLIDRIGTMNPTDGGSSDRESLSFNWTRHEATATTQLNLYAIHYRLSLYSDFTYFLDDPVNGDQFNQRENRGVFGGAVTRTWTSAPVGIGSDTTVGLQFRDDRIHVGLFDTAGREYLSTVRDDRVNEASLAVFAKNTLRLSDWFRVESGLRADTYRFRVDSDLAANSGIRTANIASPKLNLVFSPWKKSEFYLNGGDGFHSNDARGVLTTVDPGTGDLIERAKPLVRAKSAEVGLRTSFVPGLVSTVSFWALDLDSELVFSGDSGGTEASGPTRRYGVEFANFYHLTKWLAVDADLALTHARYRDVEGDAPHVGSYLPNSIKTVATAGAALTLPGGFASSLRVRYFGPQPLIEDGSVTGPSSITFNGRVGWRGHSWEVAVDVLNILNRASDDIAYYYTSRLPGEPADGIGDVHLHPAEPRTFRLSLRRRF